MNLIDRIAKLKERDKRSPSDMTNQDYETMLSAMSTIQPGDAEGLKLLIEWLDAMQKSSDFIISPHLMQVLKRHQAMAERMEAESHDE